MIKPEIIQQAIENALRLESNRYCSYSPIRSERREYICSIDGCERTGYAKGLCHAHYKRAQNGADMTVPVRNRKKGSACIDCGVIINLHGGWQRCEKHYKKRRSIVIKQAIVDIMGGRCFKCNKQYPLVCYDFHHQYGKINGVGFMMMNASVKSLSEEISKCVLLCANCHRIESYKGSVLIAKEREEYNGISPNNEFSDSLKIDKIKQGSFAFYEA